MYIEDNLFNYIPCFPATLTSKILLLLQKKKDTKSHLLLLISTSLLHKEKCTDFPFLSSADANAHPPTCHSPIPGAGSVTCAAFPPRLLAVQCCQAGGRPLAPQCCPDPPGRRGVLRSAVMQKGSSPRPKLPGPPPGTGQWLRHL